MTGAFLNFASFLLDTNYFVTNYFVESITAKKIDKEIISFPRPEKQSTALPPYQPDNPSAIRIADAFPKIL